MADLLDYGKAESRNNIESYSFPNFFGASKLVKEMEIDKISSERLSEVVEFWRRR